MSSDPVIKSVAKKLKYYFEVKRLEDGFDLSGPYNPVVRYPRLKQGSAHQYEGLHDRPLKHYYSMPRVKQQITLMNPPKQNGSGRAKNIKRKMEHLMTNYRYTDSWLPEYMYRRGRDNRLRLRPETTGHGRLQRPKSAGMVGGTPLLRSVPNPGMSRGEANRLVNNATQILLATESIDMEAAARNRDEMKSTLSKRNQEDEEEEEGKEAFYPQSQPSLAKAEYDVHGRKVRPQSTRSEDRGRSNSAARKTTGGAAGGDKKRLKDQQRAPIPAWLKKQMATVDTSKDGKKFVRNNDNKGDSSRSFPQPPDRRKGSGKGKKKISKAGSATYSDDFDKSEISTQTGDDRPRTPPPEAQYEIIVETGSRLGASTEAEVRIKLHGSTGTQRIDLENSKNHKVPFRKGQEDTFKKEVPHVGDIKKIRIGHDRMGTAFGWFLETVSVRDLHAGKQYNFRCNTWLSSKQDDGKTFRDFKPHHVGTIAVPDAPSDHGNNDDSSDDSDSDYNPEPSTKDQQGTRASSSKSSRRSSRSSRSSRTSRTSRSRSSSGSSRSGSRSSGSRSSRGSRSTGSSRSSATTVKSKDSELGREREEERRKREEREKEEAREREDREKRQREMEERRKQQEDELRIRQEEAEKRREEEKERRRREEEVDEEEEEKKKEEERRKREEEERRERQEEEEQERRRKREDEERRAREEEERQREKERRREQEDRIEREKLEQAERKIREEEEERKRLEEQQRKKEEEEERKRLEKEQRKKDEEEARRREEERQSSLPAWLKDDTAAQKHPAQKENDIFFDDKPSPNLEYKARDTDEEEQTASLSGRRTPDDDVPKTTVRDDDDDDFMEGFKAGVLASHSSTGSGGSSNSSPSHAVLRAGMTLHEAAAAGDVARVTELISYSREAANSENERGWTALHASAANGQTEVVKFLSVNGPPLDTETPQGYTASHLAAMNGHLSSLMVLAAMGASVSGLSTDGMTPLHLAAMGGHVETAKWLVANRAPLKVTDQLGRTPRDLAEEYGHVDVQDLLDTSLKEEKNPRSSLSWLRRNDASEDSGTDTKEGTLWSDDKSSAGQPWSGSSSRRGSTQQDKHEQELTEKRRVYERQQERMKTGQTSFLDSIRQEAEV